MTVNEIDRHERGTARLPNGADGPVSTDRVPTKSDVVLGWARHLRLLTVAVFLLVGCAALGGCGSELGPRSFEFNNRTGVQVAVYRVGADGREIGVVGRLDPGGSTFVRGFPGLTASGGTCQVLTLIARNQAGQEVARHEGEICPDGRWNIGGSTESAGSIVPAVIVAGMVVVGLGLALAIRWSTLASRD